MISGGRILLMQRGRGRPNGGLWDLPGGQRDSGESAFEAAWREASEEAGRLPPAAVVGHIRILRAKGRKRYDLFVLRTARRVRRRWQPQVSKEHSDCRWVDISWCARNPHRLHPVLRKLFTCQDVRRRLRRVLDGRDETVRPGSAARGDVRMRRAA